MVPTDMVVVTDHRRL